jgi:hypothetical protein
MADVVDIKRSAIINVGTATPRRFIISPIFFARSTVKREPDVKILVLTGEVPSDQQP